VMEFVIVNRERSKAKKKFDDSISPSQHPGPVVDEESELVKQEREEVRLKLWEKLKKLSEKNSPGDENSSGPVKMDGDQKPVDESGNQRRRVFGAVEEEDEETAARRRAERRKRWERERQRLFEADEDELKRLKAERKKKREDMWKKFHEQLRKQDEERLRKDAERERLMEMQKNGRRYKTSGTIERKAETI